MRDHGVAVRFGRGTVPSAMLRVAGLAAVVLIRFAPTGASEPNIGPDPSEYRGLVWHAEMPDGRVLSSHDADRLVNPASVIKVATTLWALDSIGPDLRFETRFLAGGTVDAAGVLHGDLVIEGGGDPDFHVENAFLLARRLRDAGVRTVDGGIVVHPPFWIGWEGGSEKRLQEPDDRFRLMGVRLRAALDPRRWTRRTQRTWRRFADAHGLDSSDFPRIVIKGEAVVDWGPATGRPLAVHRSKPVRDVLRRFNCWSNNDIERFESTLGSPRRLDDALHRRWGADAEGIRLVSTSGLGSNRMSARQIVRLVGDLDRRVRALGLTPGSVLPVVGCDPGTLRQFFPKLNGTDYAGSLAGKTGSLVYTDHGVSAFAGIARTAGGDLAFAVVYPRAGRRLHWARSLQERLVLELIDLAGGPMPAACPAYPPGPADDAVVFGARRDAVPTAR